MIKDLEHQQDDRTVLLDNKGHGPASTPLTDFAAPPRFEQLEQRMVYAARLQPSEAFTVSVNPLVAAASELLSEVAKLKYAPAHESLHTFNSHLTEGVKRFEARAAHEGVESTEILAARYVLCTVVDEAVVTTEWGSKSEWSQMSLLSSFHSETFGGETFFRLLDSLSKSPIKNLPMLELMYVCLSLGFQGKYRVQARGMLELDDIRDGLYRQIRHVRGDVPREFSPHWQGLSHKRRSLVRIVPVWMVVLFTAVCLLVMYSGFAWVLGVQRETVLRPFQVLDPAAVQPTSQL